MNGARIAPIAPTANIVPICLGLNCNGPDRYDHNSGSHAPQIAYCKNIISDSLTFRFSGSGAGEFGAEESTAVEAAMAANRSSKWVGLRRLTSGASLHR